MTLRIGVIADDLTGATDIAGFLVEASLRTVQVNGLAGVRALVAGTAQAPDSIDAVVVGLKTRSIPQQDAVSQSLEALDALRALGAEQVVQKYCSTFDSTSQGNIGPVADALLQALGADFTVAVPALPVNGRTVDQGVLFVGDVPLAESGMRHHPITPMTDSSVVRLLAAQTDGRVGLVPSAEVEAGAQAVRAALAAAQHSGFRYAVVDTLTDEHLDTIGEALLGAPLITGGSGVGGGLARALARKTSAGGAAPRPPGPQWAPFETRSIVLSGSASRATSRQIDTYVSSGAPAVALDIDRVLADPDVYVRELSDRVRETAADGPALLVYAPAPGDSAAGTPTASDVSAAIESWFGNFARELSRQGVRRFIVAGGETSGAVTLALGVVGFEIGPLISPGVPLTRSLDGQFELVLKSGNFGDDTFFADAQRVAARERGASA